MGLRELEGQWDGLPAAEAVARAWRDPGDPKKWGTWHRWARRDVQHLMPLLARALDRLLVDLDDVLPATDERLWEEAPAIATVACREVSCRCGHLRARHVAPARRGGGPASHCRARDCRCFRFACSCGGRRLCASTST